MTTTWNPSDKSANITLSGGNLIATWNGSAGGLRSTTSKTSGKLYFEVTLNTFLTNVYAGLANSSYALTAPANTANVVLAFLTGATILGNGATLGSTTGSLGAGQVGRFAVDLTNRLFWYSVAGGNWNNNVANNPATGVGGISFSYLTGPFFVYSGSAAGTSGEQDTVNFGATSFAFAVPSGFSAWDPGTQAYTLPAVQGSYALTTAPHSLYGMGLYGMGLYSAAVGGAQLGVGMPGAQGAYGLTGYPATINLTVAQHLTLSAASGAYALTGFPAGFVKPLNTQLAAVSGVYRLTGGGVTLVKTGTHPGLSVSPIPYRVTGFAPFLVKGRAPLHPPVLPPIPALREATYRIRGLGRAYDPTITVVNDRPGPMRIVEISAWMN